MLNSYTELMNLGLLRKQRKEQRKSTVCESEEVLGQGSWRVWILTLDLAGTSYMTLPKSPVYTEENVFCATCL